MSSYSATLEAKEEDTCMIFQGLSSVLSFMMLRPNGSGKRNKRQAQNSNRY